MLEHPGFRNFGFNDLPIGCDVFLMDERWLPAWQTAWEKVFEGEESSPYEVGYISWAHVRKVAGSRAEIDWMADLSSRFHAVKIDLPKSAFVACAEAYDYEKRPTIFVRSEWLDSLHARAHSTFAIVDASDFTRALVSGRITKALALRDRIDDLADRSPHVSFTSFADSLLLKANWIVGSWDKPSEEKYAPEDFMKLIHEIDDAYRSIIGVETYAVAAQGSNEYYGDELVHRSPSGNHVSLNSLGLPFAQLTSIEAAARAAIKRSVHPRSELYLDRDFFLSLDIDDYEWRRTRPTFEYDLKLAHDKGTYVCVGLAELVSHLR